jgi:hypothetical protein
MRKWLKRRFILKTYMRSGWRWYEIKIGRRRWLTWQIPFTRRYSIAWSQGVIDQDREEEIAQAVEEYRAGLMAEVDIRMANMPEGITKRGEFYDSG